MARKDTISRSTKALTLVRLMVLLLLAALSACETSESNGGGQDTGSADSSVDARAVDAEPNDPATNVQIEFAIFCRGSICDHQPGYSTEGSFVLTQQEFGTAFDCYVDNERVHLTYRRRSEECARNYSFEMQFGGSDYAGPGTYERSDTGRNLAAVSFAGGMPPGTISEDGDDLSCLYFSFARPRPVDDWTCTFTVSRHDDSIMSGRYDCEAKRGREQRSEEVVNLGGDFWINIADCQD